jgi:hypothetical protein
VFVGGFEWLVESNLTLYHSCISRKLQIFQTMRRYGLGSDHAVKAITVSDALARTVAESNGNVSVWQAVTDLTLQLSKHKFGQQQPEHEASSDLDLMVPATPTTTVVTTTTTTTKQAPDLRIKPVPSIERVARASTRSSTFSTKKAKSTNKNGKLKQSKDSHGVPKDNTLSETSRPRSDSVDIVTAKLGEKTGTKQTDNASDTKTVKNAPVQTKQTPASVRAKRGRGEENEVTASTHKRSRQSSA